MSKWIHIIVRRLPILCLPLLAAGCTADETEPGSVGAKQELRLSLSTYAADPNAAADESAIRSVYVYIFNEHDVLENPGSVIVAGTPLTNDTGVLNASWRVTAGEKTIFVIANPPASLIAGLPTANPVAKADIEGKSAGRDAFLEDLKRLTVRGLVMTGHVQTTVPAGQVTHTAPVTVARRHARIDLNLRPDEEMTGRQITIKKATLRRQNWQLPLFQAPLERVEDEESRQLAVTVAADAVNYTPVCSFYTAMRPLTDDGTKPLCLDLETEIDGKAIPMQVFINTGALNGGTANEDRNPIAIESNRIYRINGTISPRTTSFNLNVQDWTDERIDGTIGGSTLGLDSVVMVKAARETLVPVRSVADTIRVKLSDKAQESGYKLTGADASTGVLNIKTVNGKAEIPITGPAAYPIGEEYNIIVVADHLRLKRRLQIEVKSVFEVTDRIDFPYNGGSGTYIVSSYGELGDPAGTTTPIPWIAEFVEDDGNGGYRVISQPDWFTDFTANGPGSLSEEEFTAELAAQKDYGIPNPHDAKLRAAHPVSGIYDLSTKGSPDKKMMRTANCYVIHAPGTYSLPLVYGNAIDFVKYPADGDNRSAYTSTADGADILKTFVNHLDAPITSPYIYRNTGCKPKDAVLVWQDKKELVSSTSVRLTDDDNDGRYDHLQFDVPQTTIRQGNAVVAVRDEEGRIMWSWHIWVTDFVPGLPSVTEEDYDPEKTQSDKFVTNFQDEYYTFMGVNLGWCDGETKIYDARNTYIRLTQAGTGLTRTLTVSQRPYRRTALGTAPYFQFGRKDPMPSDWFKGYYYSDRKYFFNQGEGKVSIGTAIQNPYLVYNNDGDWSSSYFHNIWSADARTYDSEDPVIKTIYDPCPVDYCLPASNAFSGLTYNGQLVSEVLGFGVKYNSPYGSLADFTENSGWIFYCNKMPGEGKYDTDGGIFYLPSTGYYALDTDRPLNEETIGSYWTATTSTPNGDSPRSNLLQYGAAYIVPAYYSTFPSVCAHIRPIREK